MKDSLFIKILSTIQIMFRRFLKRKNLQREDMPLQHSQGTISLPRVDV